MSEKRTIEMPDGKGGMVATEAEVFSHGSSANAQKQEEAIQQEAAEASQQRIGAAAEAINMFCKAYATDHHLSEEELVSAMNLDLLNWREYYPKEIGGTVRFDEINNDVYLWFEENKTK